MICYGEHSKIESYSSYKKRMFNKKLEKLRLLIKSIDSLSLKDEDKKDLILKMNKMLQ